MRLLEFLDDLRETRGELRRFSERTGLEQSAVRRIEWRLKNEGHVDLKMSTVKKLVEASNGGLTVEDLYELPTN